MEKPILRLQDVNKKFTQAGETVFALKKANIEIFPGELVAVIGPSGSGKSTFLTISGALQSPTSGKVFINGREIQKLSKTELGNLRLSSLGFILQSSNLVPYLKVRDQLKLLDIASKRQTSDLQIEQIFKALHIKKLENKYPEDLSGGEKQRVAIAKALYGDSRLILADEPTASLDTEKAFEVVKLLANETHGQDRATIMVTHDVRLIDFCDRIFEMKDGVLTERKT